MQRRFGDISPYVGGVCLGVVSAFSLLVTKHLLGASGGIVNFTGAVMKTISPSWVDNVYFKFIMKPGFSWQVWELIGVFFGAMAAAIIAGDFGLRVLPGPYPQWKKVFGHRVWLRWLFMFFGGILLEFGARLAGGCTSGLAISGGLQLAPSAFLFVAGIFATGIPVAWLLYRKRF